MLKQLINLFIKKNGRLPNALEMLQLKFKAAQQSGKGEVIQFPRDKITDWTKARPTTKGEVIDTSFAPGKDAKGNIVEESPSQIKARIEKQNKEAIKNLKDKMKDPEDLAGGGVAGMLGEPTFQDEEHRVPYKDAKLVNPGNAEVGDPTPGWGLSDLVSRYFLYQKVFPGVGEETRKYLGDKFLKDLRHQGYSPKDFKAYIDEQFPEKASSGGGDDRLYAQGPAITDIVDPDFDRISDEQELLDIKLLKAGEIPQYASGGRIGFVKGKLVDAGRRWFLEMMGGAAAGVTAAKSGLFGLLKSSKSAAVKDLTQIPIQNAEGMPPWFKGLVNRVIKEGVETTKLAPNKGGAYLDRQIVHEINLDKGYNLKDFSNVLGETTKLRLAKEKIGTQDIKKLLKSDLAEEKKQVIKVYQDLDTQTIRVEYQSADNMGGVDDAVHLEYKAAEEVATKKGSVKTKPTFSASEAYPLQDPKDYKYITFEGDNTVGKVDDLLSDTSALKQFGTNKALSKKELAIAKQKQKRVKEIHDNPSEELAGSGPDYDDFAEGGRVPLALGRGTEQAIAENKALEEGIALNKKRTERFNKRMIDIAIKQAPEGVLMDPPPEPNWSLIEELKNPKDRGLPPINTPMSDIVVFDDGTVYYKDTGEYYKEDGTKVTGPSKGAKPVPKTMEAAEGGRVPLKGGGRGALLEGLGKLFDEFFPGTTKLGQRSKPYPEKVQEKMDVRKALADFQERQKNKKLIDEDIKIRAKELDLDEGYLRSTHKTHIEDKAGVGSLEDFTADFNKELGLNVSKEVLRHPWRVKRSYPFSTPIVDKTGKYIGDEATQQMYPKSKKFIVKDSDELTKEIDFMRGENKITSHAGDLEKAGEGRFTKVEVLKQMFENTVKQSKSAKDKKMFTNFMKEIESNPELANDPKVWNFFTGNLPKNQKLVVYGDDTVDFWRQSEFGPHNIKTTEKFIKKHPHLTKDQAVKIQNMEPEDQIFEMKKIEALRKKNMHASGGIAGMLGE